MNNQNPQSTASSFAAEVSSFFSRVVSHDAAKKGLAAAVASVIVAVVSEALWPSYP